MRKVMRSRTARWLIAVVAGVALGGGAKGAVTDVRWSFETEHLRAPRAPGPGAGALVDR